MHLPVLSRALLHPLSPWGGFPSRSAKRRRSPVADAAEACNVTGALVLAALDIGATRHVMRALIDGFAQQCPNIYVDLSMLSLKDTEKLTEDGC